MIQRFGFWFVLFAAVFLKVAAVGGGLVSYVLVAVYALFGRTCVIEAFLISWVVTMLNTGLALEGGGAGVGRYIVMLFCSISIFSRWLSSNSLRVSKEVLATGGLAVALIVHSLLISPYADVSVLKVISWSVVMVTLFSAWSILNAQEREKVSGELFYLLIVIMILSLPLLVTPIGFLRNGSGFQGVLNHPQAFGPVMAILGSWLGALILGMRKPSWFVIFGFLIALVLIVLSEARTAGLALVIALFFGVITTPALSGARIRNVLPGLFSNRIYAVILVFILSSISMGPLIADKLENYLAKRGSGSTLVDSYEDSRGDLISRMIENIEKNPFFGIGFGIASNSAHMEVERDPVMNLPLSAQIEKGVLPVAVVEELGFVGAGIVLLWSSFFFSKLLRGGVAAVVLVFVSLLLNMGESAFFSPGGLGLIEIVVVTWAATKGKKDGQR